MFLRVRLTTVVDGAGGLHRLAFTCEGALFVQGYVDPDIGWLVVNGPLMAAATAALLVRLCSLGGERVVLVGVRARVRLI